ncbi:uncharacterized protein F4822DRAFT_386409 [Hypoxylon trugodes]|uniref:uncharacterized protein n=1 Tax=Hypoxylon trugodes TaxID=326681 RepID=UPI0021918D15|nr:uncharacterized protein F4822DRAFT_386409 [Hypoxylon trugodes]KAI1393928.1 hypothetical protein F4822DRAFT_386409 [Hypoxylon trugodes]
MSTFSNLISRGNAVLSGRDLNMGGESDTVVNLMITFLGIAFFALVMVALLVMLRRAKRERRQQEETLPQYNDIKHDDYNTRRLTIQTADGRSSILVVNGRPMLADPSAPPYSPTNIPEIHITFPDEQDEQGHNKSGRVVVVRVGETSVGLEPVKEEQLPAYEKESKSGFYSIDMDQIGGLKEKDRSQFS